jgi:surface protein
MPINNGKLRVKGLTTGGNGGGLTDFISVWDTNLGDGQPTITLPLGGVSSNYNFTVNWGDGTTDNVQGNGGLIAGFYSHTYALGGVYTITITGTIEGWSFNGGSDCQKLTSITNIGQLKLGNEGSYFYGCPNLTTIGGTFDLTGTTNMVGMFGECTLLTSVNGIESWNTSAVTNMGSMFNYTEAFNQDISGWDVSSVTNMGGMFAAALFNGDISLWNVSSVTDMSSMFQDATSFNGDISLWNVSSITTMSSMFTNATAFNQDISGWDISNVIFMDEFMNGKTTANYSYYDDLLNAWSLLTLPSDVIWDMGSIEYTSAGATARQDIIDNYGWTINDGGEI